MAKRVTIATIRARMRAALRSGATVAECAAQIERAWSEALQGKAPTLRQIERQGKAYAALHAVAREFTNGGN